MGVWLGTFHRINPGPRRPQQMPARHERVRRKPPRGDLPAARRGTARARRDGEAAEASAADPAQATQQHPRGGQPRGQNPRVVSRGMGTNAAPSTPTREGLALGRAPTPPRRQTPQQGGLPVTSCLKSSSPQGNGKPRPPSDSHTERKRQPKLQPTSTRQSKGTPPNRLEGCQARQRPSSACNPRSAPQPAGARGKESTPRRPRAVNPKPRAVSCDAPRQTPRKAHTNPCYCWVHQIAP